MDSIPARLKALRERTEPKYTVRELADALGLPHSTYASYEAPKYKKPIIPLDLAKKISALFSERKVPAHEVMALAGVTGELGDFVSKAANSVPEEEWLTVTGSVAAGVWREQTDWPSSERYDVRFGPSLYPAAQRFAVRMDGLSMNRTIQPGADLECLYVKFSRYDPKPGDLVIVERMAHDLVELTCKRLAMDGDEYVLMCESYEPEFQEPIRIGKPDGGCFVDNEINVVGIVLSAKLDLAPKDLSERRFRR